MKKFFKILSCFMLIFTFANAKDFTKDTLIVGTNATYPPFEFLDDKSEVTGFDFDLMAELSKRIGFKYEVLNMSFDGLIPALKSGKIDIAAAAMSATPARKKAVDFSNAYYFTENLFLKHKDSTDITKIDDLNGKKIGVQLGTVQEMAAKELNGVDVSASEDIFVAIMSLKNKKVDAVLVDSSIGYSYLKKNQDLVEFAKVPDGSEGFSLAFDKNKYPDLIEKINVEIENMKKDGTFDKILEKYDLK